MRPLKIVHNTIFLRYPNSDPLLHTQKINLFILQVNLTKLAKMYEGPRNRQVRSSPFQVWENINLI